MELNRENIIKALECCIGGQEDEDCTVCPYDKRKHNCVICLMNDALTHIKQLNAENEGVKEKADRYLDNLKAVLDERAEAKTEVAREIFEEIEKTIMNTNWTSQNYKEWYFGELKKKYIGE